MHLNVSNRRRYAPGLSTSRQSCQLTFIPCSRCCTRSAHFVSAAEKTNLLQQIFMQPDAASEWHKEGLSRLAVFSEHSINSASSNIWRHQFWCGLLSLLSCILIVNMHSHITPAWPSCPVWKCYGRNYEECIHYSSWQSWQWQTDRGAELGRWTEPSSSILVLVAWYRKFKCKVRLKSVWRLWWCCCWVAPVHCCHYKF